MAIRTSKAEDPQDPSLIWGSQIVGAPGRLNVIAIGPVRFKGNINLDNLGENPGVDGTTFSQLMMAQAISEAASGFDVELHVVGMGACDRIFSRRVKVIAHETVDDWTQLESLVVSPVEELAWMKEKNFEGSKVFAVTQHPSSRRLADVIKRFDVWAVIHPSIYSFWSNFRSSAPMLYAPNLLPQKVFSDELAQIPPARTGRPMTIGYIGALVPSKRFHDLAGAWKEIVGEFPDMKMQVMGSSSLHGREGELHPDLPTTFDYGEKILESFGVQSVGELSNIEFLGSVGVGKEAIIRGWSLAVANPTGNTETFFYSLREPLLLGLPAIGGGRQGGREILSQFPKCMILDATKLGEVIISALKNPEDAETHERRVSEFRAKSLEKQTRGLRDLIGAIVVASSLSKARLYGFSILRAPLPPIPVVRAFGHEEFLKCRTRYGWIRDKLYLCCVRLTRGLVLR